MSECDKYKKWIILHSIGELADDEKDELERHLENCDTCRAALQRQKQFQREMEHYKAPEPSATLLDECRSELRTRLRQEKRQKFAASWWELYAEKVSASLKPSGVLVGAVAFLIFGIILGRYFFPSYQAMHRGYDSEVMYALARGEIAPRFETIRPDPATEEIEIRLTSERTYSFRGSVQDEPIKTLLGYALMKESNPGLRIRSIKAIAAMPHADQEVESALIHALENDANEGVRLQAIRLLNDFPINERIKRALMGVLFRERNSGVKKEAVDALSQVGDAEVLEAFESVVQQDSSEYVQFKASTVLERREDKKLE